MATRHLRTPPWLKSACGDATIWINLIAFRFHIPSRELEFVRSNVFLIMVKL
jgi:hypothetical protein